LVNQRTQALKQLGDAAPDSSPNQSLRVRAQSVEEVAATAKTISYELLCKLAPRVRVVEE
jgi:alanine racemase